MLTFRYRHRNGPAELAAPEARPTYLRRTVDTTRIHGHDDSEALEAHYSGLERLEALAVLKAVHGCMNGLVYIGHMIEEDGEEVEVVEAVPCRRCADRA